MRAPAVLLVLLAAAPAATVPTSRTALVAGKGLNEPFGVTFDAAGTLYIVEMGCNRVSVRGRGGRLSVLAGTGEKGLAGDGGPALQARMNGPKHISVDGEGAVLIADTENHVIRRYTPRDGMIRRVAGTGENGAAGLGGPPESCQLNRPHGALPHPATGDIYVSDSENHRVIRIERP